MGTCIMYSDISLSLGQTWCLWRTLVSILAFEVSFLFCLSCRHSSSAAEADAALPSSDVAVSAIWVVTECEGDDLLARGIALSMSAISAVRLDLMVSRSSCSNAGR